MPEITKPRLWAAGLLCLSVAACQAEPVDVTCAEGDGSAYTDPLKREGLSQLVCPLPDDAGTLVIVTDENISWPVVVGPEGTESFEEVLLETPDLLGEGLYYFREGQDRAVWGGGDPAVLVLSLTGQDPVTMEKRQVWLRILPGEGRIDGSATELDAALGN